MSSGAQRDPLSGVIRQGKKVVGAIVIPDASDVFIREFNHCYGQLRMSVSPIEQPRSAPSNHPHSFRLPDWFRHVWHASQPIVEPDSSPNQGEPASPTVPVAHVEPDASTQPETSQRTQQPRRRRPKP